MTARNRVLLFPHEHADLLGAMHELNVRSKTHSRLRNFLTAASAVVHDQFVGLDSSERAGIGDFEDLMELAERHMELHRSGVVAELVLFTTIQTGQLLV